MCPLDEKLHDTPIIKINKKVYIAVFVNERNNENLDLVLFLPSNFFCNYSGFFKPGFSFQLQKQYVSDLNKKIFEYYKEDDIHFILGKSFENIDKCWENFNKIES